MLILSALPIRDIHKQKIGSINRLFQPRLAKGLFLFFRNAFIQLFTELSWFIATLCCHYVSPVGIKSPAIARLTYLVKIYYTYLSINVLFCKRRHI